MLFEVAFRTIPTRRSTSRTAARASRSRAASRSLLAVTLGLAIACFLLPALGTAPWAGSGGVRADHVVAPHPAPAGVPRPLVNSTLWGLIDGPGAGPSNRSGSAAAWDAQTNSVVMFGGMGSGGGLLRDCWTFHLGQWANCTPASVSSSNFPSARSGAAMAYDPILGAVVLFGGHGRSGALGDTWEYAGGNWTSLKGNVSPPARSGAAMAYDASTQAVELVDGRNVSAVYRDTWSFTGAGWADLTPAGANVSLPPRVYNESLLFDPLVNQLVLFGGYSYVNKTYVALGQTWVWSGTNWTELSTSLAPTPRGGAGFAWDGAQGYAVLAGGESYGGSPLSDTWSFGPSGWALLTPTGIGPAARAQAVAVGLNASQSNGYAMFFGGIGPAELPLGDSWLYGTTPFLVGSVAVSPPVTDALRPVTLSVDAVGGVGGYQYAWSGMPQGCSIASTDARGSCAPQNTGRFTIQVTVSTGGGLPSVEGTGILTVNPDPQILSFTASPFNPGVGSPVTITVATTGGSGTLHYAYYGLPLGCQSNDSASFSCVPNSSGTYTLVVQVTDAENQTAHAMTTLTVGAAASKPIHLGLIQLAEVGALVLIVILAVVYVVYRQRKSRRSKRPPRSAAPTPWTPSGTAPKAPAPRSPSSSPPDPGSSRASPRRPSTAPARGDT